MQLEIRRQMVAFYPAEIIRKMYYNLKMHSRHSSYCFEEVLDQFISATGIRMTLTTIYHLMLFSF